MSVDIVYGCVCVHARNFSLRVSTTNIIEKVKYVYTRTDLPYGQLHVHSVRRVCFIANYVGLISQSLISPYVQCGTLNNVQCLLIKLTHQCCISVFGKSEVNRLLYYIILCGTAVVPRQL